MDFGEIKEMDCKYCIGKSKKINKYRWICDNCGYIILAGDDIYNYYCNPCNNKFITKRGFNKHIKTIIHYNKVREIREKRG